MQLGTFEAVDAEVKPAENGRDAVVTISVKEKSRFVATDLLQGFPRQVPFYAAAGIAVHDFLNSNVSFSTGAICGGPDRYGGRLTLDPPDLTVNRTSFNVENACGDVSCWQQGIRLDDVRVGGQLNFGFRLGRYQRFLFGYRYEHLNAGYSEDVHRELLARRPRRPHLLK